MITDGRRGNKYQKSNIKMQNDKSKFKMVFGEIERNRQHFCLKYFNAEEKKIFLNFNLSF